MKITKTELSHYDKDLNGRIGIPVYKTFTAEFPDREKATLESTRFGMVLVKPIFVNCKFSSFVEVRVDNIQMHGFSDGKNVYDISDWYVGNKTDHKKHEDFEKSVIEMLNRGEKLMDYLNKCENYAEESGI